MKADNKFKLKRKIIFQIINLSIQIPKLIFSGFQHLQLKVNIKLFFQMEHKITAVEKIWKQMAYFQ